MLAIRSLSKLTMVLALAGCAPDAAAPSQVGTLREAADQGEARFGVPAELTLAIGYVETRWQLPEAELHGEAGTEHEGAAHGARMLGVGGLRTWLAIDPIEVARERAGIDETALSSDPALSLLATAAVLRALAEARYGDDVPAADDPGAWFEVIADYAGLEGDEARASYTDDVFTKIRRGAAGEAADGESLVLHASAVTVPDGVARSREYHHSEYSAARWVPAHSSNYSTRSAAIDRIVIHTTQGSYAGTISWFQNASSNVSTQYVIRSSDGQITQMVHEANKAWHVGTYNSRSIGIEHEGFVADPGRWYTDAMYRSSAALVRHLCNKYSIPIDRTHIIGHYEAPGATHTDPGSGWDWSRYMALVRGVPEGPAYDASYVNKSHPAEMVSGERAVAWFEFRNDGTSTWSLDRTRLGTAMPQDHASPFFDMENWISPSRSTPPDHSDYSTGRVGRFTFMITAPEVTEATDVTDTLRLVQEGTTWFGPAQPFTVRVRPRTPPAPTDADGDGAAADVDCDDADPARHPGAEDACGDGVDMDCDGEDPACEQPDGGPVDPDDAGAPPSDAGFPTADAGTDEADAGTGPMGGGRETLSGGCSASAGGGRRDGAGLALLLALGLMIARRRRA